MSHADSAESKKLINEMNVSRFEVIDGLKGRVYVKWPCKIEISIQDEGRTLKVFVQEMP